MTAEAHDGSRTRSPGLSERLRHAAHRYVLPALGAGAATLGGVLFLGAGASARPYLPYALLGLGAATVASSVAFHHWQDRRSYVPPAPSTAVGLPPSGTEIFAHQPAVPHSGIGRAATTTIGDAGARMWHQWDHPAVGALGATLAGPVSGSAYVPESLGHPGPYSSRDHDLLILPLPARPRSSPLRGPVGIPGAPRRVPAATVRAFSGSRARLASRRRVPFTEDELDALFPPDLAPVPEIAPLPLVSAELSPIPLLGPALQVEHDAVALLPEVSTLPRPVTGEWEGSVTTRTGGPSTDVDHPTGRFRILPSLLLLRDPLYVETIHPIPPHLRGSPGSAARPGGARPAPGVQRLADRTTGCIGCLRPLAGFRGWVMCPGCHGALCRRCLGASFLASSEGQCSQCRPWHTRPKN